MSTQQNLLFQVGDRVLHAQSGIGTVETISDGVINVKFDGQDIADTLCTEDLQALTAVPSPLIGALGVARRGVPVISARPKSKLPFDSGWQNIATTDEAQIRKWAAERPGCNFACVAKPDGVCFFETDEDGVVERYEKETGLKFEETFTVRSRNGRFHYYFLQTGLTRSVGSITQKEIPFGSFRQNNAYVVAPFAIHPISSEPYTVANKAKIIPMPNSLLDWLVAQRVRVEGNKISAAALAASNDPIPLGQHDVTLTIIAGKWRQDGLEYEEIRAGLIRVCEERCVGYGSDYVEMCEKIAKSICRYPKGAPVTVTISGKLPGQGVVEKVKPEGEPAQNVPIAKADPIRMFNAAEYVHPAVCLEGDVLSDLAVALTRDSGVPPQYVQANLITAAMSIFATRITPPWQNRLVFHPRYYSLFVSDTGGACKKEALTRAQWAFGFITDPSGKLKTPAKMNAVSDLSDKAIRPPNFVNANNWGSGIFMLKQLAKMRTCDTTIPIHLIGVYDEGKTAWSKQDSERESLESVWLTLFSDDTDSKGSCKNGDNEVKNTHVSQIAFFTMKGFKSSFEGTGNVGDGYVSRLWFVVGSKKSTDGKEWPAIDTPENIQLAEKFTNICSHPPERLTCTEEAFQAITEVNKWIESQDKYYQPRLAEYFDKQCLWRAIFSGGRITPDVVRRAKAAIEDQLFIRVNLWPVDSKNRQAFLENKILSLFKTYEELHTVEQLMKALSIGTRDGEISAQEFKWTLKNLNENHLLYWAAKTRRGNWLLAKVKPTAEEDQ